MPNARPRVLRTVKKTLEALCRDVLSPELYLLDVAPSDYLFRVIQSNISGEWLILRQKSKIGFMTRFKTARRPLRNTLIV